jgi:hypothetical protein
VSQFLQQKWQFRVSDQMTNPAGLAKMLLHEEDLKVAEVSRNRTANSNLNPPCAASLIAACAAPCASLLDGAAASRGRCTGSRVITPRVKQRKPFYL